MSGFRAQILTLFPEMFPGPLAHSLPGKALRDGLWQLDVRNIRDAATDRHKTVDDMPFGGGAGMVLKPDVVDAALQGFAGGVGRLIYLTPRGAPLTQGKVKELAQESCITLLCGRYEGVDQRVLDAWSMEDVSIGDYVLAGGEIPAMILLEACLRYVPGVLGNEAALTEESFSSGLLEYPHYTRPAVWQGRAVPEILLSGHHEKVREWRLAEAERLTAARRPDLWQRYEKAGNKKKA